MKKFTGLLAAVLIALSIPIAVQAQAPKNLEIVKKLALRHGKAQYGMQKMKIWVVKDRVNGTPCYTELSCGYNKGVIAVSEGIQGVGGTVVVYHEKTGDVVCNDFDGSGKTTNSSEWSKEDANGFAGMVIKHLRYYGLI